MIGQSSIAHPLATLLARLAKPLPASLEVNVSRLCDALADGHVCLPPDEIPALESLRHSNVIGDACAFTPLVLDECGLYLRRYHQYESGLASAIRTRAAMGEMEADEEALHAGLARYFSGGTDEPQRAAAERAVRRAFSVVTGGPGTGKTYTATVALLLIAEQAMARGTKPAIALAAPSGKAATRLSESLRGTLAALSVSPDVAALLPTEASTLHRLLGLFPGKTGPRHDAENPIPFDVVVVDEASMVDLPTMAKLFAALRQKTRLVLLGDKDQLASVEAGNVLGDICAAAVSGALAGCVTELVRGRRFAAGSGIAAFAALVKSGDLDGAVAFLRSGGGEDFSASEGAPGPAIRSDFVTALAPVVNAESANAALAAFSKFRVLCAVREGPAGVESWNTRIERALNNEGLIRTGAPFYQGRPLLVTRNDYGVRLFNGDIGIIAADAEGHVRAAFPGASDVPRMLPAARLPEHETAFAMTIHKSQGSEFDRVMIVLPEHDSPVLSRELLYTAVTRARSHVRLLWSEAAVRSALSRSAVRWSGLRARLA